MPLPESMYREVSEQSEHDFEGESETLLDAMADALVAGHVNLKMLIQWQQSMTSGGSRVLDGQHNVGVAKS